MNYLYLTGIVVLIVVLANRLRVSNSVEQKSESYGKVSITRGGHPVRSRGEKKIADFLFAARIEYVYEPIMYGLRPDFYLPEFGTIIEYFGMATLDNKDGRKYRKKMAAKLAIYRRNNQKVIQIFPYEMADQTYKQKIRASLRQIS